MNEQKGIQILKDEGFPVYEQGTFASLIIENNNEHDLRKIGHFASQFAKKDCSLVDMMLFLSLYQSGYVINKNSVKFLRKAVDDGIEEFYFGFGSEPDELVYLMEYVIDIVKRINKYDLIYAIDRSGRILGFFIYVVLSKLGLSKKIDCYFIGSNPHREVVLNSKKMPDLKNKKILLVDDHVGSGATIDNVKEFLESFGANVDKLPFTGKGTDYPDAPKWYHNKKWLGVTKDNGVISVDKGNKKIAHKYRKILISIAKMTVEYIRHG